MNIDALIHAYQEELRGYRQRGQSERAKLVEEELRRLGHSPGVTPREDVLTEPASTTPEAPQTAPEEPKEPRAPKRPTTRKKR
jgi:hypothetical protein